MTMTYQRLGRSNLQVSRLCLGTMMFGGATPDDAAADIVASARAQGINFIDTADVYHQGASERVVGRLLQGQRHDWVLATKTGNAFGSGPNEGHLSRAWLLRSTDNSLQRLQTDHIDILYLHRDHPDASLEEAVAALGDLIRAGKIRYFGLSNFRGWRIAEVVHLCRALGVPPPVVCQPYYNLLNRGPEVEILPACAQHGLGVVPYSPVARGVLTGKYPPGQPPASDSRAGRGDARILATEFNEVSLRIAADLVRHAQTRGLQPGHFATAWVLANPTVTSVIAGPRTLAQMEDYYPAVDVVLNASDEALVDGWVAPGHPASPGYTDPSYPVLGRPARALR